MALSGRYRAKAQNIREEREKLAIQRSKEALEALINTEQFKFYASSFKESDGVVDKIVETTVKTTLDPVVQFTDTLISQGFKKAQIRKLTHNLYVTYISGGVDREENYEDMVGPVANFILEHQELYNTFSPDMLQ